MTKDKEKIDPDYYPTPYPIVREGVRLALERYSRGRGWMQVDPHKLSLLDPGCGPQARFASKAASMWIESTGVEIQDRENFDIEVEYNLVDDGKPTPPRVFYKNDFIGVNEDLFLDRTNRNKWNKDGYYDLIVGNPPFSMAEEFIHKAAELVHPNGVICFLLRLGFWGTAKRYDFFKELPPAETNVLFPRPSFYSDDGVGPTDGTEYAFFIWDGAQMRSLLKGMGVKPAIDAVMWRECK